MKFELILRATLPGGEVVEHTLPTIERDEAALETLGLSLAEGKVLLQGVQERIVGQQLDDYLAKHRPCASCGRPHPNKGRHWVRLRTPFGALNIDSPRWRRCSCEAASGRKTFSPLAALLTDHVHPELLYLETKWASLVSYGMTTALLHDVLPLDSTLSAVTLRNHVLRVAKRAETKLGEEQGSFIEGCPATWQNLPLPDGPLTVGIDGGYVRHYRKSGCFEVIAGKSVLAFERQEACISPPIPRMRGRCFGFVQTVDGKPRRRLFEHLKAHGLAENQHVVFLSDGGDSVRNLQTYLSPQAEYVLDWFHITMRLTVLGQYAKGLRTRAQVEAAKQAKPQKNVAPDEDESFVDLVREEVEANLASIKHYLWHGNTFRALELIGFLTIDLGSARPGAEVNKLDRGVRELQTYIENNKAFIPNDGEKYRQGETITTAFVESTVNQVIAKRLVKKQSMSWTPRGAHLLLQVRTRVLNDELEDLFREWHPGFRAVAPPTLSAPGI